MSNNKSKIENCKSQKVWRIFHFTERFELPEDIKICRKSGLQYTKRFVGVAAGDEAVGYHRQISILAGGDGRLRSEIKGLYGDLVDMAAEQSFAKRGYLIDAEGKPLTSAQIARLLGYPSAVMRKMLRSFERVKLLERVDLPDFDMSRNDAFPKNSGKFRKPLKKDKTNKTNTKTKGNKKRKATNGLSASGSKKKKTASRKGKSKRNEQGQVESTEPRAEEPSESDAGDGIPRWTGCETVPASVKPTSGLCVANWPIPEYDRSDMVYGRRIYLALGYNGDTERLAARKEICSFASKWHQCRKRLANLSPPEIDRLGIRGMAEAGRIARYMRRSRRRVNPGAVWNSLMDKIAGSIKCNRKGRNEQN